MQQLATTSYTYTQLGLHEYLLVAHPNLDVATKINAEKQHFFNQYGQKIAIKTKPHITIANFVAKEMMEETILRFMQRIFSRHAVFETALNNYSGFPPHTIYLRVQNQQPFKQLANDLKTVGNYIHSCSCPPAKLINNPHLSIARRLPEAIYLKAIADYSQKSFYEKFTVNDLVLLRRSHPYDSCKIVQVFPLYPQVIPANTLFD